jgi:hypothetical protein
MMNERLDQRKLDGAAELLSGLEEIALDSGVDAGGAAIAIFRSAALTARYHIDGQPSERLVLADRFCLVPFVADAFTLQEFFILGAGRKHLRLFRYRNGACEEMPMPTAVPPNLAAAGGFDQPDHDLINRSSAGRSAGAMSGVQFGTASDRESLPEHVHHFFGTVDRELKSTLRGKPLLVLGVQEDLAAYKRAAKHDRFLEAPRTGSAEFLTVAEVAAEARNAAHAHYARQAEQALADYLEMPDRSRTLSDVDAIVRAAEQGRVHRLCVRSASESTGPGDDEINNAVVETLSAGGEVFLLPQDRMPVVMGAILRY